MALAALLAQPPAAEAKNEKEEAKKHAKKGSALFQDERYEDALREFEKAFEIFPAPALLYNMGQCHLFLGAHERAIEAFESFLSQSPDTPYRADVERLIGEAKAELRRVQAAKAPEPPPPPPAVDPDPTPAIEPPPPPPPAIAVEPPPPLEEAPAVYETWWFWTIIGGVAVAAGGAAIAVAATGGETTTVLPMGDLGVLDRR
jgi:tetratricopeptide (TPR) repeat protein